MDASHELNHRTIDCAPDSPVLVANLPFADDVVEIRWWFLGPAFASATDATAQRMQQHDETMLLCCAWYSHMESELCLTLTHAVNFSYITGNHLPDRR